MTNNFNIQRIEDFPLDSLILYSLREFSSGNLAVAENLHNIFQLKVKESLKQAQKHIDNSDNFKADNLGILILGILLRLNPPILFSADMPPKLPPLGP